MTKPNKDGWILHRGGECPVAEGEPIDIRFRVGEIIEGTNSRWWIWDHCGMLGDILAYRLHQPETKEPTKMTAEKIQSEYKSNLAQIAIYHAKNEALVQQLRDLGFAFLDSEPEEDMSDPKNWRVGDLVEVLDDCTFCAPEVRIGDVYPIREIDSIDSMCIEPDGTYGTWDQFKFHSRPTKK